MLVKSTDAPKGMTLRQVAMKAVTATVSDLAAKGVKPEALLISLALPPKTTSSQLRELASGFNEAAKLYGTYILGGDVNEGSDLIIDCLALALSDPDKLIPRNGAKPGDIIATTGLFGGPPAALRLIQEGDELKIPEKVKERLLTTLYEPKAHLREGLSLGGLVSSSIDSSDGLVWSIHEIAKMSQVKAILTDTPISSDALLFAEKKRVNPLELALYGGEEYNLIVTLQPEKWIKAVENIENIGGTLYKIGYIDRGKGIYQKNKDGILTKIEVKGWEHLGDR